MLKLDVVRSNDLITTLHKAEHLTITDMCAVIAALAIVRDIIDGQQGASLRDEITSRLGQRHTDSIIELCEASV